MNFNDLKTQELVELYKKITDFTNFLEKEKQNIEKQ